MSEGNLRILHLPSAVGGMSWGLSRAERMLGLSSTVLLSTTNPFAYPGDICLNADRKNRVDRYITLLKAFWDCRSSYDLFHFNFGSSLIDFPGYGLHLLDLPWYPSRAPIVVTYNGCDARLKYKTMQRVPFSACHDSACYGGICNDGRQDKIRQRRIEKFSKYASHMFAVNPDLLWNLPPGKASFLPYAVASWDFIEKPIRSENSKEFVIVHAPTNRVVKGTKYILAALEHLRNKYPCVSVRLIEGLSNVEAVEAFRNADLVVDQVLVGWYGGLAVEAMRQGTPVAAFVREEDLVHIPSDMAHDLREALVLITPDTIEESLSLLIENRTVMRQLREAAAEYVNHWHAPEYVAGITKAVYEKLCLS